MDIIEGKGQCSLYTIPIRETKRWTPKYASRACLWALIQRCSPHRGLELEESAGAAPCSTPGVPFAPCMQMGPMECCSAQPEQLYMGTLGENFYPGDRPSGEREGEQASSVPYPSSVRSSDQALFNPWGRFSEEKVGNSLFKYFYLLETWG